jgi:hypothetical protein
MIKRREFIVKTTMGAAAIPLSGISCCGTGETGIKPAGGKVIDAHLHLVPCRIREALDALSRWLDDLSLKKIYRDNAFRFYKLDRFNV